MFVVPVTTRFPAPVSWPLDMTNPPTLDALVKVSVPPVTLKVPVPLNERIVSAPLRNVVLNAPRSASSAAPGSAGLLLQFVTMSQNEAFGPIQLTSAA